MAHPVVLLLLSRSSNIRAMRQCSTDAALVPPPPPEVFVTVPPPMVGSAATAATRHTETDEDAAESKIYGGLASWQHERTHSAQPTAAGDPRRGLAEPRRRRGRFAHRDGRGMLVIAADQYRSGPAQPMRPGPVTPIHMCVCEHISTGPIPIGQSAVATPLRAAPWTLCAAR